VELRRLARSLELRTRGIEEAFRAADLSRQQCDDTHGSAVVAAMLPFFSEQFGNASSAMPSAVRSQRVKQARKSLQALLGTAFDHEIVFTSGGTESDNAAILSALDNKDGRNEIVTTAVEHPAILALRTSGSRARDHRAPDRRRCAGRLDIDAYQGALGPRTRSPR